MQTADNVPPKSLARDMAFAKLRSRILSAAEAVQAAKLHSEMPPERQAILLSAEGLALARAGRPCTNRQQDWHRMRNGGWPRRYGSVLRRMQVRAPRVLGGKAMMGTCASNLWPRTLSTRSAVQHTLRRLIKQAGGYADFERHVPEVYDWVRNINEAAPVMRCAILDVVSWFPGVLQQLWIDVSVRCSHAERCNESASKPGWLQLLGWKTGR